MKLAFMTFGSLLGPYGDPAVQGFWDRVPSVFDSSDQTEGFVARSRRDPGVENHTWGLRMCPKCWGDKILPKHVVTLSVWEDLESVTAFAYSGAHGEAMKLRREWFEQHEQPEHVAWWVDEGHQPTFQEAADRMDLLHDSGPTASAFSLRKPYDPSGTLYRIDNSAVRRKAETVT